MCVKFAMLNIDWSLQSIECMPYQPQFTIINVIQHPANYVLIKLLLVSYSSTMNLY